MEIAHFMPIGLQTWPPHAILVSDWSISRGLIKVEFNYFRQIKLEAQWAEPVSLTFILL
jgi:hypothetical protein